MKCCGADEGREAGTGNVVRAMLSLFALIRLAAQARRLLRMQEKPEQRKKWRVQKMRTTTSRDLKKKKKSTCLNYGNLPFSNKSRNTVYNMRQKKAGFSYWPVKQY